MVLAPHHRKKLILLRNIQKSLGMRLILRYDRSNGKEVWDLAHGLLGVCIGQGHLGQLSGNYQGIN